MIYRVAPYVPYLAVVAGLYGAGSAWAALISYHAGILIILLMLGKSGRVAGGKSQLHWGLLPLLTLVFMMGGALLYALWPLLGRDGAMVGDRLAVVGITHKSWPLLAAYFCLANSILEELFWRGCLGSDSLFTTTNDMFFAGYHSLVIIAFANAVWAVPVFLVCVVGGWLWRRLRSVSGGLLVPVVTHIAADASIAIAVQLRVFS